MWSIYIIINNLYIITQQSQEWRGTLLLGSITIIYERSEDANNKDKDLKDKIYYIALKTISQYMYSFLSFINCKKIRQW